MKPKSYQGARRRNFGATNHRRYQRAPRGKAGSTIPIEKLIHKSTEPAQKVIYQPKHRFIDFGLNQKTTATLEYLGFNEPSAIQDQSIPYAMEGRDVIGLANTGTGKTAAFLLPIINSLAVSPKPVSVLILAPTRELAGQIQDEFRRFSAGQNIYSALVVGGVNIGKQIRQVQRGPQAIIGTPGRVQDLIDRRVLRMHSVQTFVLDEADRMCDMGFLGSIKSIASELSQDRQTLCFSATMTSKVKEIVSNFMKDPVTLSVVQGETNDHIEQDVVYVSDKADKVEKLIALLQLPEFEKVIIFGETKFGVQRLADSLTKCNLPAVAIHGNKSQSQRNRALNEFKANGGSNVLVATDVAARGIDVDDVTHVINFDIPKDYEDYVHRIGRTGRAGRHGKALTFVTKSGY